MKTKMFLLFLYMGVLVLLTFLECFNGLKPLTLCDYIQSFYGLSGIILGAMGFGFLLVNIMPRSSDDEKMIVHLAMILFGFGAVFIVV